MAPLSSGVHQTTGRLSVVVTDIEIRASADGGIEVRGHAALFDTVTYIGPDGYGFEEVIAPGAFAKTLADGADVRFLFNHNPDLVLARTKSGTLSLREDRIGLLVEARLAPTTVGRDLAVLLKRGDVSQMSFGFRVVKDRWETIERDGVKIERRTVLEAQLLDVSGVTYPAYDETDLALREATLARELHGRVPLPEFQEPAEATPAVPETTADPQIPADVPEPAPATPRPAPEGQPDKQADERSMPLHERLLRHASGDHAGSPRALCPACVKPEPAPATPAA